MPQRFQSIGRDAKHLLKGISCKYVDTLHEISRVHWMKSYEGQLAGILTCKATPLSQR